MLVDPGASGIVVGGSLDSLTVDGYFRGQGSATATDLGVGLNLSNVSVLGNGPTSSPGGIQLANINVGKNISNFNVAYGIFRSWITAGVSINEVSVGADGVTAVYNTEIDAGTSISNVTLDGDLTSGFPTGDTSGYPTRIIAGKVRSSGGRFHSRPGPLSGQRNHQFLCHRGFADQRGAGGERGPLRRRRQLAATGALWRHAPDFRLAPRRLQQLQRPRRPDRDQHQPVHQELLDPFVRRRPLVPTAVYDTAIDPNIHVNVLDGGTITATVSGSVISTPHDDSFDFTGIFAVNTLGVDGGLAP